MCQTAFVQTRVIAKFFSAYMLCHEGVSGNGSIVVHTLNVSTKQIEFKLSPSHSGHFTPKKVLFGNTW